MFKFSKGSNKPEASGVVEANHAIQEMEDHQHEADEIETRLSIPDTWEMTDESHYVYAFHNSQSPKLKKNQISIYGMELNQDASNKVMITGLIRSTVVKDVHFDKSVVILIDKNGGKIARKTFDLSKLGTMPSNTARPWEFHFDPNNFLMEEIDKIDDGWKLAFEIKPKHQIDFEPSWEASLTDQSKTILEKIVDDAPELGEKEVNLQGIKAEFNEEGDLIATVLIRNGHIDKNMTIEQLPLKITDANNQEVVRGTFTMEDFSVKANTSKPWTFIFPEKIVQGNPDFSSWKVMAITDSSS